MLYCIIFGQRTYKKIFSIGCINIYLFLIFFYDRFCPVGKFGVTSHCLNTVLLNLTLCEICPNTQLFSGPYFPVFGLNTESISP